MAKRVSVKSGKGETPQGFAKHAQEFFHAADLVLGKADGVSLPAYFLLGRSIELSLKAFLLHSGVPISVLRSKKLGHNLDVLLTTAKERGIQQHIILESLECGVVQLLSFDYAEKRLEYRNTGGTYYLPLLDVTWGLARKLAYEIETAWSPTG